MDKAFKIVSIKAIQVKLGSEVSILDTHFPHVAKAITCCWGDESFHNYVHNLTTTEPTEERKNRKGFPLDAMVELGAIVEVHNEVFPELKPKACAWL